MKFWSVAASCAVVALIWRSEGASASDLKCDQILSADTIQNQIQKLAKLRARHVGPAMVFDADSAQEMRKQLGGVSESQWVQILIEYARTFSLSPISNFRVGAVLTTSEGDYVLGTNLEFPGATLNHTIHGEQFAIVLARSLGYRQLKKLSISAAPCGHCRQFINEIRNADQIAVEIPGQKPIDFSQYLRHSFGPQDLGVQSSFLGLEPSFNFVVTEPPRKRPGAKFAAFEAALQAAKLAYAPYSQAYSGIGLALTNGHTLVGSYIENAAFNPSVTPLLAALIVKVGMGWNEVKIQRVALIESPTPLSQRSMTEELLRVTSFSGALDIYQTQRED